MSDAEPTKFEILRDVDRERPPVHAAVGVLDLRGLWWNRRKRGGKFYQPRWRASAIEDATWNRDLHFGQRKYKHCWSF